MHKRTRPGCGPSPTPHRPALYRHAPGGRRQHQVCGLLLASLACWSSAVWGQAQTAALQPQREAATTPHALRVLEQVNHYRAQRGLAALQADAALSAIAAGHSQAMARSGRLAHDGFSDRFARSQAMMCVENLAAGFGRADALVEGWKASPSHHANLLAPQVRQAGIADVEGYVTLLACDYATSTTGLAARQ